MKLEKDKWYKFDPYHNDWSTTWYMKATGDHYIASKYVEISSRDSNQRIRNCKGHFGEYKEKYQQNHVECSPKEVKWLEEMFRRDAFFPYSEFKCDEVINDYNIF